MCFPLLPVRPPDQTVDVGNVVHGTVSPLLVAPVVDIDQPVADGDFSKDDLLICGRCKPTGDELFARPKPLANPKCPSPQERALHEMTHLPYADWCPYCVAGKRPNAPRQRIKTHSSLPLLCVDYAFFGEGDAMMTFRVAYARPFGVYFASVVDAKGPTQFSVQTLSDWIIQCGLVRFLYRSDQEKSLKALLRTAVRESGRNGRRLYLPGDPDIDEADKEELGDLSDLADEPVVRDLKTDHVEIAVPEHSHVGESPSNWVGRTGRPTCGESSPYSPRGLGRPPSVAGACQSCSYALAHPTCILPFVQVPLRR